MQPGSALRIAVAARSVASGAIECIDLLPASQIIRWDEARRLSATPCSRRIRIQNRGSKREALFVGRTFVARS